MARLVSAAVILVVATALAAPSRFSSSLPYEPLLAKLKASGGDPAPIIHARSTKDLMQLESGKRYKFALDDTGTFAIAPLPADTANNEYVHPILANNRAVKTAGGIVVEHANGRITRVTIDEDSKSYCPTLQSLDEAARALEKIGVDKQLIARQDRAPKCGGM